MKMFTSVVHGNTVQLTRLFVIKQKGSDKFWACSTEHSCGWSEGSPKQSFTLSELIREIRRLIDNSWFTDCEIIELCIRPPLTVEPT